MSASIVPQAFLPDSPVQHDPRRARFGRRSVIRRQQKQRRGILILVVLSLLFMFVMIAVTFVLIANRQNSTASKAAAADQLGDTPHQEVNMALDELIRGSNSPLSPFYNTSLLEDRDGSPPPGGAGANPNQYSKRIVGTYTVNGNGYATVGLASTTNEYDGRVITVIPGSNTDAKGSLVSSRIIASDGANVYLLPFRDPTGKALVNGNYDFLINGREFAGTGKTGGSIIVNPVAALAGGNDPSAPGGENESYDAADFNNPHLAYYDPLTGKIKPSFHDPAMIAQSTTTPKENQYNSFRAIKNTAFDSYQWDVDNDGDGYPDSIWIDPGFPIQVSRDGRLYKRLIAPLILDLDGRLNLNTAGTTKEIAMLPPAMTNTFPFATGAAPGGPIQLGRGHGFGPAEISIMKAPLGSIGPNLLRNKGRYNSDNYPGPDTSGLFQYKLFGTPDNYLGSALAATRYTGSPPDHWGRYIRGIDSTGNVLFANYWQEAPGGETANSPYMLDMSRDIGRGLDTSTSAKDNPFSASELERFLRGFDYDGGNLPNRIFNLTSNATEQQFLFHSATTDSWDMPVLGVLPLPSAGATVPAKHISELVPANLRTQAILKTLVPPDMLAGLKFNLNWPFGDGRDNNNNGVVDEAGEDESSVNPRLNLSQGLDLNTPPDGSASFQDNPFVRQQMAKYLYVLMTLIQNPGLANTPNEQVQQRLAQWAVNVVDFMDADNVMTCFEYDVNIADGWDPNANGYLTASDLTAGGDLRVVWGVEQPALLLTEAFAWHDRRVRDSKNDDGVKKKRDENDKDDSDPKDGKRDDDPTLDQALIPRGPGFVELYAPHSPMLPVGSADLYDYDQTNKVWRLKLDKLTPDSSPVWRILVTTSNASNPGNDYATQAQSNPQVFTGQTVQNSATAGYSQNTLYNGAANIPQATIERIVVFAKKAQINGNYKDLDRLYCYADDGAAAGGNLIQGTPENLALFGGQYAVLFPHTFNNSSMGYTAGGAIKYPLGNIVDTTNSKKGIPCPQGISINYSAGNPFAAGGSGKNVVQFTDSNGNAHSSYGPVDFAAPVTIPISSYSNASGIGMSAWSSRVGFSVTEPLFSNNRYYPLPVETNPATGLLEAYGAATDDGMGTTFARDKVLESSNGDMPNAPLVADGKLATGTYSNYKTLILQRVADPTRNYDENNNPYITVDWLPIDITVFNGDDRPPAANAEFTDNWDPDDPTAGMGGAPNPNMGPRQRGELSTYKAGPSTPGNIADNSNYHLWSPKSMMLGTPNPGAKNTNAIFAFEVDRGSGTPAQTFGYLNASYGDPLPAASAKSPFFFGAPQRPFPNLSWNNRPFLNPNEVMLVPASQAGRLGMEYGAPYITGEDYAGTTVGPAAPFGHLLNFFASSNGTNYHLILDWITTGSPFKGTETWFDPAKSQNFSAEGINKFRFPFNSVHGYREPGKININTVSDPRVWDAVMGDWGASGAGYGCTFQELVESRRGSAGNQLDANGSLPTYWGNPFRVASAAGLAPSGLGQPTNNVGLLRKHPSKPNLALFGVSDYTVGQAAGNEYRDASRHRLMAVENIERLSNLVTTRSNVYAIWVTVGYFEVTPGGSNPDGYQIGQELGSDTGEIKRHRGFGIYDRSIPVGYERGMNHNVEKGFLIKKILD